MKLCLHGLVYLGWIMDYVPFLIFLLYLYMYLLCDYKRFWTWTWTWNFRPVIFKLNFEMVEVSFVNFPADECHSFDLTEKSAWVQVMACCHQATSHYLNQCWPSSVSPYGITRPQWVNIALEVWAEKATYQKFRCKYFLQMYFKLTVNCDCFQQMQMMCSQSLPKQRPLKEWQRYVVRDYFWNSTCNAQNISPMCNPYSYTF